MGTVANLTDLLVWLLVLVEDALVDEEAVRLRIDLEGEVRVGKEDMVSE